MKKNIRFCSFLFLFFTLITIGLTSCTTDRKDTAKDSSEEQLITVLNPAISSSMAERVPLTPRTGTLEGKTIYLVDLQWGGPQAGYSVFEVMKDWFSKNMPSVNVEIRRSAGGPFGDDPDLRAEIIAKKAGGVVIGIGG